MATSFTATKAVSRKQLIEMDRTSVSIKGVLDDLRTQLNILDEDIKTSEKSKLQFDRQLAILQTRKEDLQNRVKFNTEWAAQYDLEVGPFAKKYQNMTKSIGEIYEHAKEGHQRGIVVLKKEFGYHPTFKRPQDTFSATPFIPK